MKYTVLGATGFVGRHLVASLRADGHDVNAPAKESTDVFDRPLGHVLYCIGLTADFRSRPFDTMRAHVSVLNDVLERADFESLLYLSSTRVYSRNAIGAEQTPITVDVADPSDLYNVSKLAGESLCRTCGRAGVKVARISNIVGHDPGSKNFLQTLIHEALSGHITLQSDPASFKDYILLDDVISLLPKVAVDGREWIYNLAGGVNVAHRDIVERLVALTGCKLTMQAAAPLHNFPTIDIKRIQSEFGFKPASALNALPDLVAACRASAAR